MLKRALLRKNHRSTHLNSLKIYLSFPDFERTHPCVTPNQYCGSLHYPHVINASPWHSQNRKLKQPLPPAYVYTPLERTPAGSFDCAPNEITRWLRGQDAVRSTLRFHYTAYACRYGDAYNWPRRSTHIRRRNSLGDAVARWSLRLCRFSDRLDGNAYLCAEVGTWKQECDIRISTHMFGKNVYYQEKLQEITESILY